jgi:hypothetical protein
MVPGATLRRSVLGVASAPPASPTPPPPPTITPTKKPPPSREPGSGFVRKRPEPIIHPDEISGGAPDVGIEVPVAIQVRHGTRQRLAFGEHRQLGRADIRKIPLAVVQQQQRGLLGQSMQYQDVQVGIAVHIAAGHDHGVAVFNRQGRDRSGQLRQRGCGWNGHGLIHDLGVRSQRPREQEREQFSAW